MPSLEARLFGLIARELRLGDSLLTRETRPSDIATWDSLSNAVVFVAIQDELCSSLAFDAYVGCATLGELLDLIEQHNAV